MAAIDLRPHTKRLGGNDYVMVSGRLLLAHADNPDTLSIETELVSWTETAVVVAAKVTTRKGVFTGYAASYLTTGSPQERKTPLEVAETSAVGRALGMAGYAIEGGIASADEMERVPTSPDSHPVTQGATKRAAPVSSIKSPERVDSVPSQGQTGLGAMRFADASKPPLVTFPGDAPALASHEQVGQIVSLAAKVGMPLAELRESLHVADLSELGAAKADKVIARLRAKAEEQDFAPLEQSNEEFVRSEDAMTLAISRDAELRAASRGRG